MLFASLLFHVFAATAMLAVPAAGKQGADQATAVAATSNVAQDEATTNWAGVVLTFGEGATVESVIGTFTIPVPNAPPGGDDHDLYTSAVWLGIDGYTCEAALLRTGVEFTRVNGIVTATGAGLLDVRLRSMMTLTLCLAWYEWFPNVHRAYYDEFSVAPGDVITATVTALTPKSGVASIINNSTGQQASVSMGSAEFTSLCRESGEWIIGNSTQPNGPEDPLPLPDFGTVTFSAAIASVYSPIDPVANTLNIVHDGATLTSVSTEYDTVVIEYIGE
ncbi:concanavalin A-like lectin/glucanase domain-containing protein [Cubamyces lactineus]|nr:concanavalin A-like lectin/glucanase domain-containing protein [Cubamyces lactineus]